MRGLENFLCDMLEEEEFAVALLEKTAQYELEKALRAVRAGADVVTFSGDIAMQNSMMVPEIHPVCILYEVLGYLEVRS